MFCVCLLRLGLTVTGAPADNFRTRIHGVVDYYWEVDRVRFLGNINMSDGKNKQKKQTNLVASAPVIVPAQTQKCVIYQCLPSLILSATRQLKIKIITQRQ